MLNRNLLSRKQDEPCPGISRRELLLGLGGAAAAIAYTGNAVSAMPGHDHAPLRCLLSLSHLYT